MFTIRKDGKILYQAKDNNEYKPEAHIEIQKPNSLYVDTEEQERGLSNG